MKPARWKTKNRGKLKPVSPEGFTPAACAKFVLKMFTNDRIL